ncbi:hypothetical protein [Labrys neptuniae]|uniref:Uncharacterized protein n=1 Tax=Labrys neptuniae TaxID=376174 RepID=A0ABV3PG71_9HYPH
MGKTPYKDLTPEQKAIVLENNKKWRDRNRDKIKVYNAAHCKDRYVYTKTWREKHKEHLRQKKKLYSRRWYLKVKANDPKRWREWMVDWAARQRSRRERLKSEIRAQAEPGVAFMEALHSNTLYAAVAAIVHRRLPAFVRDDVISSIVLDVLDGKLSREELDSKTARRYVSAYNREFETYAIRSLDEDLGDGFRLLDTLASEDLSPEDAMMQRR